MDSDWPLGCRIVEVIEVVGDHESLLSMIGMTSENQKFVRVELYRGEVLINDEMVGFGEAMPLADLIGMIEENLRETAFASGARLEIVPIPAPFGRKEFEEAVARQSAVTSKGECP